MNITLTLTEYEMTQALSEFCGVYTGVLAACIRAGQGISYSHTMAIQACDIAGSDPVAPNRGELAEEEHHLRITYRSSSETEYVFRFAKDKDHENSFSFPESTSLLGSFERIEKRSRKKQASVTPIKIRVPDIRGAAVAIERYLCGIPGVKGYHETVGLCDQRFLAVNSDGTIVGLSKDKFDESEAPEYEVSIGRIPKVLHMQRAALFCEAFDFPQGIEGISKKESLTRDEAVRLARDEFIFISTGNENEMFIYRNGYCSDFLSLVAENDTPVKQKRGLPKGREYYRLEVTAR
jgi:hypothetical protein